MGGLIYGMRWSVNFTQNIWTTNQENMHILVIGRVLLGRGNRPWLDGFRWRRELAI